jgi:hypothetical protein
MRGYPAHVLLEQPTSPSSQLSTISNENSAASFPCAFKQNKMIALNLSAGSDHMLGA